jgi:hypothetical protein
MKDSIVFVLSELFIYSIMLCIVIIAFPALSMQTAFIIAVIMYVFVTLMTLLLNFSIKTFKDSFFNKKDLDE